MPTRSYSRRDATRIFLTVCLCLCGVTAHLLAETAAGGNCALAARLHTTADPGDHHSGCVPGGLTASAAPCSLTIAWLDGALPAWPHLAAPLPPPPKI